jgi:hypothetical protein
MFPFNSLGLKMEYVIRMVYRQKVELANFSNACEAFGHCALHGSVQLNPPI